MLEYKDNHNVVVPRIRRRSRCFNRDTALLKKASESYKDGAEMDLSSRPSVSTVFETHRKSLNNLVPFDVDHYRNVVLPLIMDKKENGVRTTPSPKCFRTPLILTVLQAALTKCYTRCHILAPFGLEEYGNLQEAPKEFEEYFHQLAVEAALDNADYE